MRKCLLSAILFPPLPAPSLTLARLFIYGRLLHFSTEQRKGCFLHNAFSLFHMNISTRKVENHGLCHPIYSGNPDFISEENKFSLRYKSQPQSIAPELCPSAKHRRPVPRRLSPAFPFSPFIACTPVSHLPYGSADIMWDRAGPGMPPPSVWKYPEKSLCSD